MPTTTIPFDPSLVLGMVIDTSRIAHLEKIAEVEKKVNASRDQVNALIRQKLSLDLTLRELISLGASDKDLKDLKKNIDDVLKSIETAAGQLGQNVITTQKQIGQIIKNDPQTQIGSQIMSPIDFSASTLSKLPLSSDTMDMDVQYFRNEEVKSGSTSYAGSIATYVGSKVTGFLGASFGAQAAQSTNDSMNAVSKGRVLLGTVVICVNATHRMAQVFSPLVLDVENAIENYTIYSQKSFPDQDLDAVKKIAIQKTDPKKLMEGMPVIAGESYGSSFVGFVHFEQIEKSQSFQQASSMSTMASAQAEADLFLAKIEGSFGMDAQSAESLKSMFSNSQIQSHCSLITMGIIPSIKSNMVTTTVEKMNQDPKALMGQLKAMQDGSNSGITSMGQMANQSRKEQTIQQMKTDYIQSSVSAISQVDTKNNQVIDMNSLMTALDDYVKKASEGNAGVPINFYIKYISERTIAIQWMEKYYPQELHEMIAKKKGSSESDNDNKKSN